ncbi:FAD-dependent oxidoreductase [Maribacter sp. X9]|uniref:FAD-dependent oxidoreductase n=1 Tax=Maribacter sp. X9 TaxID=3402159 RepID=UPI003AF3DA99
MGRIRILSALILVILSLNSCSTNKIKDPNTADVIIYGGTSAGISAAIQTARSGRSVIMLEPTNRIGGLTTGGLGQTDIGNKQVIGGISREFYQNIKKYYQNPSNWVWQKQSDYASEGQSKTNADEDTMWTFEPSVALAVFEEMMKDLNIKIVYNERLDRTSGVIKKEKSITSITMESGNIYTGKMFIDATYEGDLLAASNVTYTIGREANSQYGETLNGVQANDYGSTLTGGESLNAANHNFVKGVDPYTILGDTTSSLLPGINPTIQQDGSGDNKLQAYCFRMCLTDHDPNRIPFEKPAGYQESDYELLLRNYEAGYDRVPWINSKMPNGKTDTNNRDGFSTDFIGQNYDYPEASYEEREHIVQKHRIYQQGLMWTLANHPRIPEHIRTEVSAWGTCKDEFERKDGWQEQLYIREARRMVSDFVMVQKHCERLEIVQDGIGMAAYTMDSHNTQRYLTPDGFVSNEGNVEAHLKTPFPISYRSIVPKKEECNNLLVPVCLSSSHIAFGSIRMEPVFMVLGQSTSVIANMAIEQGVAVQDIPYDQLRKKLIDLGQIIE